jgi:hypothetical protein
MSIISCKSTKSIANSGEFDAKISVKQIIKAHKQNDVKFNTFVCRLKVDVTQGDKSKGYTVSLRMEKDKTIWMSKLGIVKALITPNRVAFYNKLDNTFFDGDFSYLSDLLGTDLDFKKVQNMILGQALFKLEKNKFKASIHEKSYLLTPKKQEVLFELFLLFNPTHYKMDSQQIMQEDTKRFLEIDYLNYQKVDKETLPKNIKIIAVDKDEETIIDLEFKSVKLNQKLKFPFRIPSGYDEIAFK